MFSQPTRNAIAIRLVRFARKIVKEGPTKQDDVYKRDENDLLNAIVSPLGDKPVEIPEKIRTQSKCYIPYVISVALAMLVVGLFSDLFQVIDRPILFGCFLILIVGFELIRIDVFGKTRVSPSAAVAISAAIILGPWGAIIPYATVALIQAIQGKEPARCIFNAGVLSLPVIAGAAVFDLVPLTDPLMYFAGTVAAAVTAYIVNSILLSVIVSLKLGGRPFTVWQENLAWMFWHYVNFGLIVGAFIIGYDHLGIPSLIPFTAVLIVSWKAQKDHIQHLRSSILKIHEANQHLRKAKRRLELALSAIKN